MQPSARQISTCPTCGGVLEETPSGGLGCISCLLRAGIGSEEETAQDSTPDALGGSTRFGVYEIDCHADGSLCELGRGAMGVTYRATDTSLQRKVALKIIKIDIAARSADARERFMREARAAAALRHENVATIHQFGMRLETGQYFYAMELIEGETLEERVRRAGPLDARTTIKIAQQVTSALAAAEKCGLVHRDLKPANLMLVSPEGETAVANRVAPGTATQRRDYNVAHAPVAASLRRGAHRKGEKITVKIIDFGLAKAIHTQTDPKSLTHDRFVGTPAFASPEQFEHAALDVRSDIYSLGETLWFALTGKTPFAGRNVEEIHRAQKSNALPTEQLKAAHVPSRLKTLLESMLALEPASRPGTGELAARLQRCSPEARTARRTRVTLAAAALLILGASAAIVFLSVRTPNSISNLGAPEKSIAVLPFENRSEDQANAYFADGIQDEILTRLSKIADLKVISRTSTLQYQSKPANLREIAKQLGIANILEGSVQKVGGQVRVNVQLINAQTDSHLWADSYDRNLTDIFGVESEIAKGIAESLQAKLTGREEQALAVRPTNNPEAYDAYLRGLAFAARSTLSHSNDLLGKASRFFEQAVRVDPNFALAWARLSRVDAQLYFVTASATSRDAAKSALENAQKLEPNSAETLLALGYYQYWALRDYGSAKTTFGRLSKLLLGSSEVPVSLAAIARREGQWNESIAYFEQALALDPRNVESLSLAAETYAMLRQFPAALKLYDRVLDITPNDPDAMASKAGIYQAQGNLQEAAKLLEKENRGEDSGAKLTQLRLERNYGETVRLVQDQLARSNHDSQVNKAGVQAWLALMQRVAGNTAGAKVTAEQARNTLEQSHGDQPETQYLGLSQAYAATGQKDLALKAAEGAVLLYPRTKDPMVGPVYEENLALIQTIVGENSRAIAILSQLLQTPYWGGFYAPVPITPALLRLDPLWDPLRGDPAFQKLCEDKLDKRIAVLPFENLSDPHDEYFSDGLSEELISALAQIRELKVIGRSSSFRFKDRKEEPKTIGEKLGVSTLLEGTVRKQGNRVRIVAALTNAADGIELWTRTFDRELKDIFAVQEEIAKAVAESLKVRLLGSDASSQKPAAHNAVLHSDFYFQQQTAESVRRAITFLQEAVRLDPNYAVAYAKLSQAWRQYAASFPKDDISKAYDEARRAADNAVSLAPDLVEVRMAVGLLAVTPDLDFRAAEKEFRRVLESAPHHAAAKSFLGVTLSAQGRLAEAEQTCREAVSLDPLGTGSWYNIGRVVVGLGRYKEAEELFRKGLEIQPQASRFHSYLALLDIVQNRHAQAMTNARLETEGFWRDYAVALVQQAHGDRASADAALKDFIAKNSNTGAFQIAVLYAVRKEPGEMFKWLDTAYATHDSGLSQLAVTPFFLPYRDDPRLTALCQKLNVQLPVASTKP